MKVALEDVKEESESGVISCGFVFGISFVVRHKKKTSRPMKRIGAQVMIQFSTWYHCNAKTYGMPPSIPRAEKCRLG